jgi:hypothetical protein
MFLSEMDSDVDGDADDDDNSEFVFTAPNPVNSDRPRAIPRCGLCRQNGHNRRTCHLRNELNDSAVSIAYGCLFMVFYVCFFLLVDPFRF